MSCIKSLLLIFAILAAVLSIAVYTIFMKKDPSPVVELKHGKVQGVVMKSSGGREFYGYLGIPFALPPVGPLRFMSPVPSKPWEGVWDASFQRPLCPQLDFLITGINMANFGSEDCLYLNVFKPSNIPEGKKLPVLVHIHGGYFHCGGTMLSQPFNFMDHNVIIVSLSYRLGALGFLNTGDGVIRGNMGLRDQQLGLRWVQENVEAFGGDNSRVTLVGESAGSASVQYQMLSPASKGLFSRVIRQSGSSLNYWTMYRNSKEQAKRFANNFNCPTENSKAMLECLRAVDIYTLVDAHRNLMDHPHKLMDKFVPSIETVKDSESFLTEEPRDLLKSGRFIQVPVLAGMARDEGLLHSTVMWANQTKLDEMDDWFSWAPKALHYPPDRKDISQKLRDFYFGKQAKHLNSRDYIQNLTNLYGDHLFNLGIVQSVILEQKHNVPVHLYLYGHEGGFNMGTLVAASQSTIHPIFGFLSERLKFLFVTYILGQEYKHDVPGVAHADEIGLIWGGRSVENALLWAPKDKDFAKDIVKLWVDFAENKQLTFRGVDFIPSKGSDSLKFLHIHYDKPEMIDEPFKERRKFWETISIPSE